MKGAVLLAVAVACAPRGHWPPRPAERPATPMELEFYDMAVHADDPAERGDFVRALTAHQFRVVPGQSRRGHWDVYLTHEGDQMVATLRSDDFFVDEAVGPDVETLAATLARSARVKEFCQNSGLPQQHALPESLR